MLKRKNSLSLLVSKLDTRLIDKFLSLNISKEDLKKFDEQEKKEMIAELTDLKNLRNQSESEIYKTLDCMFSNNQFFMYCGPLLLNINPGPNHVNDYLNLANWMQQNSGIPYTKWKPHLYSMMNSVYHSLIKDRRDQVVTFVGQVGSGKTFNLVHSLEFFCFFHSQEGMQMEFFETMHKSMQLIHIMGSIFRENNIESSSCGILMKMGFDDNFKICNFDIDAKIVDFTLPFSENGRSFSILHALVTGASPEIKRILDLPDREINLNFFRKFHQNFNQNTKERFKLNDYEIWTRFHSLLNFFDFSKNEVIEVLQLMAFILLCNEAAIGKKRTSQGDEYVINKSVGSKKLSKNLNINEEDFLKRFGSFKNIAEMKNTLISLMKFAYYAVFEYIKAKVKTFLANYFEKYRSNSQNINNVNNNNNTTNNNINKNNSNTNLNDKSNNNNNNNFNNSKAGDQSFYQTTPPVRNIFFIDTPGEVKDQTLGGLFTNLTNECLNLFTGTEYMSVVDKINQEKIDLKNFTPIHSFYAVEALIGKEGLANFLSQNFTEKNFKKLKSKIARKEYLYKTMKFIENLSHDTSVDFTFEFKFSNKSIFYNYESLYMETKSLMMNAKILSIFEASRNTIVKSQMKFLNDTPKNFYTYSVNTLAELFKPIEGLTPYIVYCLHSNNSLKSFFGNEPKLNLVDIDERNPSGNNYFSSKGIYVINKNQFIPNLETAELLKNSLIFPIVHWEWFGFHEWIEIEVFLKEFRKDFESVKEKIFKNRFKNLHKKTPDSLEDIDLKTLTAIEVVSYILNVLCTPKQYVIGEQHILLKKGTLKKIREIVNNMVNMNAAEKTNLMSYGPDGKLMRRSSIDRSKGTPYRRMSSGRSVSIAGLKSQNTVNSRSNLGETNKFSRQNSIGRKGSKAQFGTVNNDIEENVRIEGVFDSKAAGAGEGKGSYYKAHCSLKVFRESTEKILSPGLLGDNNELNINHNTNSKLNLNNNNNNNSRSNLNKVNNYNTNKQSNFGSKSNLSSLLNYNLNNANIQLLEDTDINNFITYSNKYNLYNYISFNKKLEISSINENSADQIHTTNLESEFDMYKRDENVVIPKPRQFNYIKNLFDYTKIDGFHIYDYNEFLPFIRMIQTNWRCYKSRKVYKIFRLVCRKIVMIQKWIRAWITKKKYKKFSYANKCIVFIQRMYKRHFFKLSQAATLFQSHFRRKKAFKRYLDKLAKKDLGEEDSEEEELITKNANPHLHGNEALNREGKSMLKKELQSVSMSKYEKRKSIDQSSLIRRNQLNMSLLAEMEVDTDKRKILDILMNNSSVFKGIANKDVKQLDNDLELFKKNIAGKTGFKKTNLAGRNVQERLIEYGEMVKFKQTEKKMDQLKKAEEGLSFKPMTNTNLNVDLNRHGGKTIQERTEYRKLLKEKKLEAIRNKYQQDESELTFKPEINYKSKNIKRSVNDLMKWKEHKESVMEREKKFKDAAEMEEIRKNSQGTKINKVSEIIVKNKENSILQKKQENENKEMEEDFDLWPEINKAYVKDEDEAVDRPMLSEDLDHNEVLDLHI